MVGEKPTVSVLMGVYYRRKSIELLKESVSSILNQSFSSLELLICDDGSTPEAMAYLDEVSMGDSRVRCIRNGNWISLPTKLNACLAEARGEWIARMDDDDFSYSDRFKKQLEHLTAHPEISFVGCNVNLRQNNEFLGKRILPEQPTVRDFYFVQPYIHPTLMFRKEVLLNVGGYSEEKSCILCEDYDLLLRLYAAGYHGYNLQECLLDYTVSATAKGNRKMSHRWNEVVTRFHRFRELGVLPAALPYVMKPIIVGLIPEKLLYWMKEKRRHAQG